MGNNILKNITCLLFAVIIIAALSACGSGGGGNSGNTPSVHAVTVSGVAATGEAIVGAYVYLKDSDGTVKGPVVTDSDGKYSFDVTGLTAPFYIYVDMDDNGSATDADMFSVSMGPGTANVNPLSNVAVAAAGEVKNPADVYNDPKTNPINQAGLNKALADIKKIVDPMLGEYTSNDNPITSPFAANKQGLDLFFDDVNVKLDTVFGTVTFTDKIDELAELCSVILEELDTNVATLPQTPSKVYGEGESLTDPAILLTIIEDINKSAGTGRIWYSDYSESLDFESTLITSVIIENSGNADVVIIRGSGTVNNGETACSFIARIIGGGENQIGMNISCPESLPYEAGLQPAGAPGFTVELN